MKTCVIDQKDLKRVKVLTYDGSALCEEDDDRYIEPIFYRNGWYYDRISKLCWKEWNGKAWIESCSMFLLDLALQNHNPLCEYERHALRLLLQNHRIPKRKMYELLSLDGVWHSLRSIHYDYLLQRREYDTDIKKLEVSSDSSTT